MIWTECVVFAAMFGWGMLAAAVATLFLTLGGASKAWRAVFDVLTPLAVGAAFFFGSYLSSGGVFRLYAAAAFFLGAVLFRRLYKLCLPAIKRVLKKLLVPIKSLETRVEKLFAPVAERLKLRKTLLAEKRKKAKEKRLEQRTKRREAAELLKKVKRQKRDENRRKRLAERTQKRQKRKIAKGGGAGAPIRQIH